MAGWQTGRQRERGSIPPPISRAVDGMGEGQRRREEERTRETRELGQEIYCRPLFDRRQANPASFSLSLLPYSRHCQPLHGNTHTDRQCLSRDVARVSEQLSSIRFLLKQWSG